MESSPEGAPLWDAPPTADDGTSPPTTGAEDALREGARIGRYVVLESVGRGGMGVVYAAYDRQLDRKIALKMVTGSRGPDHFARLVKEAQALAKLSSPHVVTVHEVGEDAGRFFIAMEFVQGSTLADWIRREPGWRAVLGVFAQAGQGLADAHRVGIVHRDFKPANVLVDAAGRAKVCDFGLAVVEDPHGDSAPSARAPHAVSGTRRYMSPEMARGERADVRSDVYAFAVSLAEALSHVDVDASLDSAGLEVALQRARWSPSVPARIRAVIRRALAADPLRRYAAMEPLLRDLEPEREKKLVLLGVAGAACVLVLAGGAYSWQARRSACLSASDPVTRVWNPDVRHLVREAFVAPGRAPYLATLADDVVRRLDGYASEVGDGLVETCRASVVRKELPLDQAEARRDCLMGRAAEVRSLTERLRAASPSGLDDASFAVGGLSAVEECRDPRRAALIGPAPADPARREAVRLVRARLLEVTEQNVLGHYDEAARLAHAAADEARAADYAPVRAEAEREVGVLETRLGHYADAEAALRAAITDSDVARDDLLRAAVATDLVDLSNVAQAKFEQGLEWGTVARAALARAGGDESREGALENHLGSVLWRLGRYDESVRAFDRALALRRRTGETHELPGTLNNKALVLWDQGDLRKALDAIQEAEKAFADLLGEEHPTFASILENEGNLWLDLGRPDRALAAHERVLQIRRRSLPPTHAKQAQTLQSIGEALAGEGDLDAADRTLRAALEAMERLDDDALAVAAVERSIGVNEQRRGNWAASEEMLRRALAAYAKAYDASHPESARLLLCLAALELDAGRPADAERDADRARAVLEGGAGDAEDLANAWTIRAEARLARGDREGGRSGLARAVEGLSAVRGERPVAYVIAASRLEAIDLALGRGPADATTEAPEDLADRTGVEARFARDYAAAIAAERSYAAGHLEAADDVGRSGEALEKTAYVDRLAVTEVRQWARAHTRR